MAARSKVVNIKLDSGRHETNLKKMDSNAKTLVSKGFHPNLSNSPISFSALLTYLEGLVPKFDELKVIN